MNFQDATTEHSVRIAQEDAHFEATHDASVDHLWSCCRDDDKGGVHEIEAAHLGGKLTDEYGVAMIGNACGRIKNGVGSVDEDNRWTVLAGELEYLVEKLRVAPNCSSDHYFIHLDQIGVALVSDGIRKMRLSRAMGAVKKCPYR